MYGGVRTALFTLHPSLLTANCAGKDLKSDHEFSDRRFILFIPERATLSGGIWSPLFRPRSPGETMISGRSGKRGIRDCREGVTALQEETGEHLDLKIDNIRGDSCVRHSYFWEMSNRRHMKKDTTPTEPSLVSVYYAYH